MPAFKRALRAMIQSRNPAVPASLQRFVRRRAPFGAFLEEPIGQIFLADETFDTFLCVNDFYTTLNPERPNPCVVDLALHDARGDVVARRIVDLAPNGSMAVSVREVLAEGGARCEVGLATCQARPRTARPEDLEAYKGMGRVSSHFFTYYLDPRTEAMAIIHPQDAVNQEGPVDARAWRSGQSIVTRGLHGLSLYQANHSRRSATVTYTLHDGSDGRAVASRTLEVAGLSAGVVHFSMEEVHPLPDLLHLRADRFPAPNGKPLIMRRYGEGRFSMNHA